MRAMIIRKIEEAEAAWRAAKAEEEGPDNDEETKSKSILGSGAPTPSPNNHYLYKTLDDFEGSEDEDEHDNLIVIAEDIMTNLIERLRDMLTSSPQTAVAPPAYYGARGGKGAKKRLVLGVPVEMRYTQSRNTRRI
jgi:hypothetical protein